ncbi:unnamed protein product [Allacma fusca]|uniref:Conserved oligomeric Golgi complex subunit 6 n=1 Tax=Allacma fusca TaxID=39272 RepID=A0A8J2JVZ7_9HEXA|nr:unnamed protein product [Allacma fusca]
MAPTPVQNSENSDSLAGLIEGVSNLRTLSDKDVLQGLQALSKLPGEETLQLTPKERKIRQLDLLSHIEREQISKCKNFLESFREAKQGVNQLHQELTGLNQVCESMVENLSASKQNSRNLIDEIAKLEAERKKLCRERDLAQAYLNAFQLNGEDLKILRGTDSSADVLPEEFFAVFEKIQRIQSNVQLLLKIGHQTTAVEILDQMGLFQETALEKIYRWAQSHCKGVENPDLADVLSRSMAYLQIRPMLLKYVLDEYCTHRRSLVVRSFIDALTGVGNIRGIELIGSTDPARYVGDMLAWIHQSIPNEKENLTVLLNLCDKLDLNEKINTSLAAIIDGVCRPFNVRMEQTLLSGLDCIMMNKLDLRIQYYVSLIEEVLPGSQLLETLRELCTLCHQTFLNHLKAQVAGEICEYRPPGPDLTPPMCISSILSVLQQLLEESKNSADHMQTLMQMVITPLVTQINNVANRLGSPDMGVYLCNCLNQINVFLEQYPHTGIIHKALKGQIETQTDRLSSEQSSWLVAQLGVGHIYTILHEKIEDPLSTVPGMDPVSLKIFVNKLDSLIVNPDSVLLPQIMNIFDVEVKKQTRKTFIGPVAYRGLWRVLISIASYCTNKLLLNKTSSNKILVLEGKQVCQASTRQPQEPFFYQKNLFTESVKNLEKIDSMRLRGNI